MRFRPNSVYAKTRILVISSILLSIASFFTIKNGGKELYPFFSWALFSYPSGTEPEAIKYEIYELSPSGEKLINDPTNKLMGVNTQTAYIQFYSKLLEKDSSVEQISKIRYLLSILNKQSDTFLIKKVTYNPHFLPEGKHLIKKEIKSFGFNEL